MKYKKEPTCINCRRCIKDDTSHSGYICDYSNCCIDDIYEDYCYTEFIIKTENR